MRKLLLIFSFCLPIASAFAQPTVGLISKTTATEEGYVLFPPMFSNSTYLIDKCGKEVHTWNSTSSPGLSAYLLPDGTLLRPMNAHNTTFTFGGTGGTIQRLDWNGNPVWSYQISSATECQHHDVCYMPNGNVLAIVWELKTDVEAVSRGRNPTTVGATFWPDKIVELMPSGMNSATVVWEWHAWDHLVQDFDSTLPSYGDISDHPELININQANGPTVSPDWMHTNSIAYNKELDQIMISCYYFNEIWIIDHSTTIKQAEGHAGGNSGKGGDLMYRWGNPQAYGRGTEFDRKFYEQHDAQWIPTGYPDAGKVMVYNNGQGRPEGPFSTIEVLTLPVDAAGNYLLAPAAPYGPSMPFWEYKSLNPTDFYSPIISGAQRLKGGNTLICEGTKGNLFEVDKTGNTVWEYINPVGIMGSTSQGKKPNQNFVFRARQYPANYAGFAGHTLTASSPIELNPIPYTCGKTTSIQVAVGSNPDAEFQVANPFRNNISLKADGDCKDVQVALLNGLGMVCREWQPEMSSGKTTNLSVPANLPAGIYLLHIMNGGKQTTLKLVKE